MGSLDDDKHDNGRCGDRHLKRQAVRQHGNTVDPHTIYGFES